MRYIKRFKESIKEQLEDIKDGIKGLTSYISDDYKVNIVTREHNNKFLSVHVSIEAYYDDGYSNTLFETNDNIKVCFDTIIDYIKTKIDSNVNIGYYYNGLYETYLSEDFHYDRFNCIELVIEDEIEGSYFNTYKINRK